MSTTIATQPANLMDPTTSDVIGASHHSMLTSPTTRKNSIMSHSSQQQQQPAARLKKIKKKKRQSSIDASEAANGSSPSDSPTKKYSQKKMALANKLKKENITLRQKLTDLHKALALSKSVKLSNKINKLQDVADDFVKKIGSESNRIAEMNNQLEVLEAQIMDARVDMGGVDYTERSNKMVQKQIKILENKLDSTLTKFNSLLSQNKSLRSEIENLREEKQTFDEIYKKMETELYQKKQQMAECIEASNNAYTERDEAIQQLNVMLQEREAENAQYNTQLSELDEIIATDQNLNDELKKAEKERTAGIIGSMTRDQESTLKVKVVRGNWNLAEKAAKQVILSDKIKELQDMLTHVEQTAGLSIDDLIQKFVEAENTNFSLYSYVNELNTDIEKLEQQIHDIEEEYKSFDADTNKSSNRDQRKNIDSLKRQLNTAQRATENYKESTSKGTEIIQMLGPLVLELFQTVGGDVNEMEQMLGSNEVTENNIHMYMSLIENKVNHLSHVFVQKGGKLQLPPQKAPQNLETPRADKKSGRRTGRRGSRSSQPSTARRRKSVVNKIQIDPPLTMGTDHSDDDDDENEVPLTREELIQKEMR